MKRVVLSVLVLLGFSVTGIYAQYGLQTSLTIPTGYYSYVLNPGPAVELFMKIGDPDDYYSFGAALGYSQLKPTQDTFRTYAVGGGYTTQLLPGFEVIHSYQVISIGVTNDLRILPDSKFCPVAGLDVYFYGISISEDDYAENLVSSSSSGNDYWLLSVIPRIGAQYKLNSLFYLSGGLGRCISLTGSADQQSFWKPYLSITYYPD